MLLLAWQDGRSLRWAAMVYGTSVLSTSRITSCPSAGAMSVIRPRAGRSSSMRPRNRSQDAGERLVVPALHRLGVRTVDLVLLYHPDIDHLGGLGAIHKRFPIGRIVGRFFKSHGALATTSRQGDPADRVLWLKAAPPCDGFNKARVGMPPDPPARGRQ